MKRVLPTTTAVFVAVLVLVIGWFAGREANPGRLGLRLDDAWIHLVYGRELLEHGYLAYNQDTPSAGCTSPLWAVCLALVHALFGRGSLDGVVRGVILLGAVLHLTSVGVAVALARRLTGSVLAATIGGCLLGLATPLSLASFSGMEISLTALALLGALLAIANRRWTLGGSALALAALARPEAAPVVLLATAFAARSTSRGSRSGAMIRVVTPCLLAGLALAAHNLWASGSPLPTTFHAKSMLSLTALPGRLATALTRMLPEVPPFGAGLGWLAALGLLPAWSPRKPSTDLHPCEAQISGWLPFFSGLSFLLANLLVIDPVDPPAFYHQRYILPALPPLLIALTVGAHAIGRRFRSPASFAPLIVLVALSGFGAIRTAPRESRHFHNDVRNINEVQRRLGEWLKASLPVDTWIATSDAGAVRYVSDLPTIDVIGLNSAAMLKGDEEFIRSHPVAAIAIMPAWFRPLERDLVEVAFRAKTDDYSVTSNPRMGEQFILVAKRGTGTSRVHFAGYRSFSLEIVETDLALEPTSTLPGNASP